MYRSLDAEKILETVRRLRDRVHERFPEAGLRNVSSEFVVIAGRASEGAAQIGRPNIGLRILVAVLLLLIAALVVAIGASFQLSVKVERLTELIQALESGINDIIFLGIAIYFFVTLESRLKRRRALKVVHELRSLAHIIDMHQLTKDPEHLLSPDKSTASSPKRALNRFELSRYLDYCSEMLSLIGKLAALLVQRFDDPVTLGAVDQIEDLTTSLSGKIWQKINIINRIQRS
jgi:hypothetical protein